MPTDKQRLDLQQLLEELSQPEEITREQYREAQFKQRAEQYAQVPVDEDTYTDDEIYKLLTFQLGSERYGIDVHLIQDIRPLTTLTRVPSIPAFYRGIINIRGKITSVLDLRYFFGLDVKQNTENFEFILVESFDLRLALLAHHVEQVQVIPRVNIESLEQPYTLGVTADKLVVLDMTTLLTDDRLIIGGDLFYD